MTIITYRDGIMVGDRWNINGGVVVGLSRKVWKRADGALAGIAGASTLSRAWVDAWLKLSGKKAPEQSLKDGEDMACVLVVWPDGEVERFVGSGIDVMSAEFHAEGSGAWIAMGAMQVGATAFEAAKAACALVTTCGGGFDMEYLGNDATVTQARAT